MLYIPKTAHEPKVLSDFKAQENENWKPTYSGLSKTQRYKLVLHLLQEQGFLCCYCNNEIEISVKEQEKPEDVYTKSVHIEHFLPQTSFPSEEINHKNIFASCNSHEHCAVVKKSHLIPNYISDKNSEALFEYKSSGEILPKSWVKDKISEMKPQQSMVMATINLLNLNELELLKERKTAYMKLIHLLEKIKGEKDRLEKEKKKYELIFGEKRPRFAGLSLQLISNKLQKFKTN